MTNYRDIPLKELIARTNTGLAQAWESKTTKDESLLRELFGRTPSYGSKNHIRIDRVLNIKVFQKKRKEYVRYGEKTFVPYKLEIQQLHEDATENMTINELENLADRLAKEARNDRRDRDLETAKTFKGKLDTYGISWDDFQLLALEHRRLGYNVTKQIDELSKETA